MRQIKQSHRILGGNLGKGEATFIFRMKGDPKKRIQIRMIKHNNTRK